MLRSRVLQPARCRTAIYGLVLTIGLLGAACSAGSKDRNEPDSRGQPSSTATRSSSKNGAVLYTIGLSTDPYGNSRPGGFGVVLDLGAADQRKLEVRRRELGFFGGVGWIGERRILVPLDAPPFRRPLIFGLESGRLVHKGHSPLRPLDARQAWSPDGELIASQPVEPCERNQKPRWKCWRQADDIYLQNADGSNRRAITTGRLDSWTPDGRILIGVGNTFPRFEALSLSTRTRTLPLRPAQVAKAVGLKRASVGPPRWSADGRYVASLVAGKWPKAANVFHGLVIARADGTPVRAILSPYVISMFAWSPNGHRLAWTTSGFPDPHELFVLDDPNAKPRRLFATGARHFDWIAWSSDGQEVLLDDEHAGRWRLLPVGGGGGKTLPRAGGRPLWCCPVNAYARFNN